MQPLSEFELEGPWQADDVEVARPMEATIAVKTGPKDPPGRYHYGCHPPLGMLSLLFITAGMVVERKPCVRGKMSENAMRRSKATACML